MKKRDVLFFLALGAVFPASSASADDKGNNPPGPKVPDYNHDGRIEKAEKRHFVKMKADSNHDGVVDETEKAQALDRLKEKRAKADVNGDGVVDKKEKARAFGRFKENRAKADTNNDGVLDKTEKKQAIELWKESHDKDNNPPGPKGGPGTNWENPPGPKGGPGASPNRHKK